MDLEKMMADACALRMRQLADWQALRPSGRMIFGLCRMCWMGCRAV